MVARRLRVLLVEDEVIIRKYIASTLSNHGVEVVGEAGNGKLAEQLASEVKPDLILMDIRLQGEKTGIDVAQSLAGSNKTPVVFMSAYDYKSRLSETTLPNFAGYISKPFTEKTLLTEVDRFAPAGRS